MGKKSERSQWKHHKIAYWCCIDCYSVFKFYNENCLVPDELFRLHISVVSCNVQTVWSHRHFIRVYSTI